jgi:hypothetical protein
MNKMFFSGFFINDETVTFGSVKKFHFSSTHMRIIEIKTAANINE